MFSSFTLIFCLSICLWVALTFEFFLPNLNFPHFSCIADCDMIFCMGVYYHILNKLQIKFKIFAFWLIFLCSYWTENLNIIGSVIHITISGLKSIILQYSQNACLNKNQKKNCSSLLVLRKAILEIGEGGRSTHIVPNSAIFLYTKGVPNTIVRIDFLFDDEKACF